jgi:hypothetical protein
MRGDEQGSDGNCRMMRSAGDSRSTSGLLGGEPHEIIDQINKSVTLISTC